MNQPRGVRLSTVGKPSTSRRHRPLRLRVRLTTGSRGERQTFMSYDHARQAGGGDSRAHSCRLARDVVHEGVEMAGIVMEDGKRADVGGIGDPHAFLPRRMTPALV